MKLFKKMLAGVAAVALLSGCASTPMGPTVQALPQQGKPFDVFQVDQFNCKQYASDQVKGQAENANERGIAAGLIGTALGAGLGAAIDGGQGAAIGAVAGAAVGTGVGATTSSHDQRSIQQQYNDAYTQCMYAKGNQIQQPVQKTTTVIYTAPPPPPPTVVYVEQPRPYYPQPEYHPPGPPPY